MEAGKLAKAATRSKSKKPPQRDGHPWYLVTQALKDAGITARRLLLGRSIVGSFTKKIDAALHLGKSAELYQQLTSSEAAILTQLRTNKSFLKGYLHKINASETADCDCGVKESISHFLFSCKRWVRQRATLKHQHKGRYGDISYALGGYSSRQKEGKNIDGPIEYWQPDINVVKATIQFAKDTGRLHPSEQDTASAEADHNEQLLLRIPSSIS
jgi:hypothetical protein